MREVVEKSSDRKSQRLESTWVARFGQRQDHRLFYKDHGSDGKEAVTAVAHHSAGQDRRRTVPGLCRTAARSEPGAIVIAIRTQPVVP